MNPFDTHTHAATKWRDRPHPVWPVSTNGSGKSITEGVPTLPVSPQYNRGCARRIAMPLITRPTKLSTLIQCVIRTVVGCCGASEIRSGNIARGERSAVFAISSAAIIAQTTQRRKTTMSNDATIEPVVQDGNVVIVIRCEDADERPAVQFVNFGGFRARRRGSS